MTKRTAMVLLAAVLVLPSLGSAAPPPGEAPAPVAERRPVKPGGPIAVEYRLAAQPVVGIPVEIAVTAHVEIGVSRVTIEANPSAPRAVLVAAPEVVAAADGIYSWRITVVPLAAEAGYLTVVVSGEADGLAQARSVTVSLGSAPQADATPAAAPAEGEALIALPVEESP